LLSSDQLKPIKHQSNVEVFTEMCRPMTTVRPILLAFGGLIALAAAMGIGRFVYTPILPFMFEDPALGTGGLTKSEGGLIASANYVGYLAGALLAAAPFIHGSRRNWLLGALVVSALTTGAVGTVSGLWVMSFLRFAGGFASAFVLVFASALVLERLTRAGRGGLSALHFAGVGTGIAVSAVLVSVLATVDIGWRGQWLWSGAVAVIATLAVAALVPDQAEQPQTGGNGGGINYRLAAFAVAYGLFGFGYVITATFIVAIVRGSEEIRPLEPVIWIIVGAAAAPSVAFWSWVAGKTGVYRAFAAACLTQSVGVAASVLWISAPGVILAAVLLGGTIMGITALGLVGARQLSEGDPRRVMALVTAAFGVGQIIGPTFAGVLFDATGSFLASSLTAAAGLAAAAAIAVLATRGHGTG